MEAASAYDAVSLESYRFGDEGDGETYAESIGVEDDRFELVEYGATIAPTLQALPARDRIVLHLRFVEDMTQAEIAERVGVSQMHVSRLIRRALERCGPSPSTQAEAQFRLATGAGADLEPHVGGALVHAPALATWSTRCRPQPPSTVGSAVISTFARSPSPWSITSPLTTPSSPIESASVIGRLGPNLTLLVTVRRRRAAGPPAPRARGSGRTPRAPREPGRARLRRVGTGS